jgi:hypothetical protein
VIKTGRRGSGGKRVWAQVPGQPQVAPGFTLDAKTHLLNFSLGACSLRAVPASYLAVQAFRVQ